MKRILSIMMVSLLVLSFISVVSAQIATDQDRVLSGSVTPDKFGYGFKVAFQNIVGVFSQKTVLLNVQRRLAETKVMLEDNKIPAAQKAYDHLQIAIDKVKDKSVLNSTIDLTLNLGQQISQIASQHNELNNTEWKSQIQVLIDDHKAQMSSEATQTVPDLEIRTTRRAV